MNKTRYPGIMEIEPGKYLVRARATDPRTGKRKEVKRRYEGTLRAAFYLQQELLEQIANPNGHGRQRLADYAASWLDTRLRSKVIKQSTADKYATDLDLHILPAIGDYWIDQLRPADVKAYLADKATQLGEWKLVNQLRLMRTIARDSVADGLAESDWCARVQAPEPKGYDEDDPNLLTGEEMSKVLEVMPDQWRPMALLFATTGLRWGELSGLRWDDIDPQKGVIRIRRTNWKGQPQDRTKTKGSKRTIALLAEVDRELRSHWARMARLGRTGDGWIFPAKSGGLHRGTPFNKVLTKACKDAGVRRITPHGLRRTFNNLGRQVTSRETLKAITGHATDAMLEHYSVVSTAEKKQAAAGVLRLVRGPGGEHSGEHAQAETA